jgi:hypothetical protein
MALRCSGEKIRLHYPAFLYHFFSSSGAGHPVENDCLDVNNATIPSGFNPASGRAETTKRAGMR